MPAAEIDDWKCMYMPIRVRLAKCQKSYLRLPCGSNSLRGGIFARTGNQGFALAANTLKWVVGCCEAVSWQSLNGWNVPTLDSNTHQPSSTELELTFEDYLHWRQMSYKQAWTVDCSSSSVWQPLWIHVIWMTAFYLKWHHESQ